MYTLLKTISAVAIGFVLGIAVHTPANASFSPMSAEELAKEFGQGTKVCEWTSPDGKAKGEDFYFKNQTAWSGEVDRYVDSATDGMAKQGSWKILGRGFWTKFDERENAPGIWMNLEKIAENTYKAYDSSRQHVKTMTCK